MALAQITLARENKTSQDKTTLFLHVPFLSLREQELFPFPLFSSLRNYLIHNAPFCCYEFVYLRRRIKFLRQKSISILVHFASKLYLFMSLYFDYWKYSAIQSYIILKNSNDSKQQFQYLFTLVCWNKQSELLHSKSEKHT